MEYQPTLEDVEAASRVLAWLRDDYAGIPEEHRLAMEMNDAPQVEIERVLARAWNDVAMIDRVAEMAFALECRMAE
jgi:hypothetical protein